MSTIDPSLLLQALEQLADSSVFCIGDIMLDRFHYGSVDRISPEAPVPVFLLKRDLSMLGGAGNTAANCVTLGARTALLSVTGDDGEAKELQKLVKNKIGAASVLIKDVARKTSVKQRYIAGNHQLLRVDSETKEAVSHDIEKTVSAAFANYLPQAKAIILSDYGKGLLTPDLLKNFMVAAKKAKTPVIVDPKGRDYTIYKGAYAITPNLKELSEASSFVIDDDEAVETAARHIIETCGIQAVIATRGPDGMSIVTEKDVTHIPTRAREVWDVSGAGDTVIATIASALAAGLDLITAAHLANYAAGIVVGKIGTATATIDEIRTAILDNPDAAAFQNKTLTLAQAKEKIERWRARGEKIGFTNGVFDLLHSGHIHSLQQARRHCDRLIVAINSDQSVKRLKGPERPIISEIERAAMLSALECVDLVLPFSDDTPYELIKALLPDRLIKGADYKEKDVVGGDIVKANGGQIILAEIKQGFSTTNIIEKLRKA